MKKLISMLLALSMIMALAGCSSSQPSGNSQPPNTQTSNAPAPSTPADDNKTGGDTIKIGVIAYGSAASRASILGYFMNGWEVAADQVNASGGIDGKQIEIKVYDPENDASMIGQRCTDAKSDGCVAIVFAYGDDMAPAAGKWAQENHFPVMMMPNTSTEVTLKNWSDYAFNCGLNAWSFAKVLAQAAVGDDGMKNFVFCGTDGAATVDAEKLFLLEGQKINPNFELLASYRVSESDSEFSNIIASVAAAGPDMVMQQGGGPSFVSWIQQAQMFNLFENSDVYNDFVVDSASNTPLLETGNFPYGKTHGIFLLPYWDKSAMDAEMTQFYQDYMSTQTAVENNFVGPSDWGLSCYRCMKAALLGIQDCAAAGADYTDSEVLTTYIKNISWTDCTGTHQFRDLDNQLTFNVYYGTTEQDSGWVEPIANNYKTYTAEQCLPNEQEMKDYAAALGVTGRF